MSPNSLRIWLFPAKGLTNYRPDGKWCHRVKLNSRKTSRARNLSTSQKSHEYTINLLARLNNLLGKIILSCVSVPSAWLLLSALYPFSLSSLFLQYPVTCHSCFVSLLPIDFLVQPLFSLNPVLASDLPRFSTQNVTEGGNVTLHCPPRSGSVKWTRGEDEIEGVGRTLPIQAVEVSDAGNYTCEVDSKSYTINLQVLGNSTQSHQANGRQWHDCGVGGGGGGEGERGRGGEGVLCSYLSHILGMCCPKGHHFRAFLLKKCKVMTNDKAIQIQEISMMRTLISTISRLNGNHTFTFKTNE